MIVLNEHEAEVVWSLLPRIHPEDEEKALRTLTDKLMKPRWWRRWFP